MMCGFINEDPDKDGVGGSLYVYVENSATNLADPLGTDGLIVGPNTKPEWITAFNEVFAEALNRINQKGCRQFLCKNKKGLDPASVLNGTEYRILPLPDSSKTGAQTNGQASVFLNSNGPFFGRTTTLYIPSDQPNITTKRQVPFGSTAAMRAFILLHELGHQIGLFPADLFPFINGRHSLRVLENCFRDVRLE